MSNSEKIISKYRLETKLGEGGMGEVWRAVTVDGFAREVAIKVVRPGTPPEIIQSLMDEAKTLIKLPHHPNMVILLDVVEEGGELALVMEFIRGASLTQLVRGYPSGMPLPRAQQILKGMLDGVGHAHKNKVIHRDLKPDNILISHFEMGREIESTEVKILDFGLARLEQAGQGKYTQSGAGTFRYMSPEQIKQEPQGPFTDVYALGLIACEILTGRLPFDLGGREDIYSWGRAHCEMEPIPLGMLRTGLPHQVDTVIQRALAKDGSSRWPDAVSFGSNLLAALSEVGSATGSGPGNEMPTGFIGIDQKGTVVDPKVLSAVRQQSGGAHPPHPTQPTKPSHQSSLPGGQGYNPSAPHAFTPLNPLLPPQIAPPPPKKKWGCFKIGCVGCGVPLLLLLMFWQTLDRMVRGTPASRARSLYQIPQTVNIKGGALKWPEGPSVPIRDFEMSKFHVTVAQYQSFTGTGKPKIGKGAGNRLDTSNHPVTDVSYSDAQAYVRWLSNVTEEAWFLPSEEEYEYAASNKGQNVKYPWGNLPPDPRLANFGRTAIPGKTVGTTPVGQFRANELGLFDMVGNAWCWTASTADGNQILKGGSWEQDPDQIGILPRLKKPSDYKSPSIGFRVAKR